jgi:hypothetical protein
MKFSQMPRIALASLLSISAAAQNAPAAAPIKLNGPLVADGGVDGSYLQISPNGGRVLYLADQLTNNIFDIFSVPIGGGTAVKLNGTFVAGQGVTGFGGAVQFSPDSNRVLYWADQDTNNVNELYSVPSTGGTPVKLNGTLVTNGDVSFNPQFSLDSSWVVYLADQHADEVFELFSVPSTGGTPVKLHPSLPSDRDIFSDFRISSGSRVVYRGDQSTNKVHEIYSVSVAGGTPIKLNGTLVAGAVASSPEITPNGSRVIYHADQVGDSSSDIFSVPITGGTPVKLNAPPGPSETMFCCMGSRSISANSSRLWYITSRIQGGSQTFELYSASTTAAGTAAKLNAPLVAGGSVDYTTVEFSANSDRVYYRADQDTDEVFEIYGVPSTGGTPLKLSGTMVSGGDVFQGTMQISPDSSRVLYSADQDTNDAYEIYSVPATGGTPVKLNSPLAPGQFATFGRFTPDSTRVVYMADQDTPGVTEVFIVPAAGGTPVKINGPLVNGSVQSYFQISPTGGHVIYRADQDGIAHYELYSRVIAARWIAGSSNWDTNSNWNNGQAPDEVMRTVIDLTATVTASGAGTRSAFSLDIGGVSGTPTLQLASGASINVINGVTIKSNGVLRGVGGIVGDVMSSGSILPGSAVGSLSINGDYIQTATGQVRVDLASASSFDTLDVTGAVSLAGTLDVDLSGYSPVAGDRFDILDWGSITGTFDTLLFPPIASSLMWNTLLLYTTGELSVTLAGDFNADGTVDSADYALWRKGPSTIYTPAMYDAWRANFGESAVGAGG